MAYISYLLLLSVVSLLSTRNVRDEEHAIAEYENEVMRYQINYSVFQIGEAEILFRDSTGGGDFILKAEARSTGLITLVKRLNYIYESYLSKQTGLPYKFKMDLTDNRNYYFNEMVFDRESREDSTIVLSHLSGAHVVSKNIHDILTGFYLFREEHITKAAKNGKDVLIETYFIDEVWNLHIRYAGKEQINTRFGRINCLKFKPVTVVGDFFRNDDDMTVWFTDDANHIPVRIRLNLTIGALDGYLVDYQKATR